MDEIILGIIGFFWMLAQFKISWNTYAILKVAQEDFYLRHGRLATTARGFKMKNGTRVLDDPKC